MASGLSEAEIDRIAKVLLAQQDAYCLYADDPVNAAEFRWDQWASTGQRETYRRMAQAVAAALLPPDRVAIERGRVERLIAYVRASIGYERAINECEDDAVVAERRAQLSAAFRALHLPGDTAALPDPLPEPTP